MKNYKAQPAFSLYIIVCLFFSACLTTSVDTFKLRFFVGQDNARKSDDYLVTSDNGAVSAAHPLAAEAGAQMLERGGNAVDAAVAASFVISVVRPQSTGLGGGGFLLLHDSHSGRQSVYDFRERAPSGASPKMYLDENGNYKVVTYKGQLVPNPAVNGHLSVAVPGLVKGLIEVHKLRGKLAIETVMAPAIFAAENGFKVYPSLARDIESRKDILKIFSGSQKIFMPRGGPLKTGEVLIQKDLAKTLRIIAKKGSQPFYDGDLADKIVSEMQRGGGIISRADLRSYRVIERVPLQGRYRDFRVISMPPPSSGGVHIIEMLNMLEPFDVPSMNPQGEEYIHLLTEVMRRAFADRAREMGDSDFVDVPVAKLTSKAHAKKLMESFSINRASRSSDFGLESPAGESPSTTHISVMDKWGNAVASTQTVNYSFGSCVVAEGTGIILNDEMDDFTTRPGHQNVFGLVTGKKNDIKPGKTPLSSMSPTFLLDRNGKLLLALGSPGGPRIINATLQTIINVADFRLPLLDAVHATRIHHQWIPDVINYESEGLSEGVKRRLKDLGHELRLIESIGDVQAVQRLNDGRFVGVSDNRGDGKPTAPR